MTTTTLSPLPRRKARSLAAFSLVEVIIGASLSCFILAGVLSTFLFLGRSGANVQNYNDMEAEARRALEVFAEDTRQASSIAWATSSKDDITMLIDSIPVRYYYDSGTRIFYRTRTVSGVTTTRALVTGIVTFEFKAYGINGGASLPLSTTTERATASKMTKQLQVSLESTRNTRTASTASNTVLSARFILRNKKVTA
jgi:Tfp pilus assembly protein PilW